MEIGGYMELQIDRNSGHFHPDALKLNSASNAFRLLLKKNIKKVYLPNYICSCMEKVLAEEDIAHSVYHIDKNLEITHLPELQDNERLLYVNYFGVKNSYASTLAAQLKDRLVVDNSQAFFSLPLIDIDTIYSPRKFLGVSDGGYLMANGICLDGLPESMSHDRVRHLVGRSELSATEFYSAYLDAEASLELETMSRMSKFTDMILGNIDYPAVAQRRRRNYHHLHQELGHINDLYDIAQEGLDATPLAYPFLHHKKELRRELIDKKLYVAQYWSEVAENPQSSEWERHLSQNLLPLPIDQRYAEKEMQHIASLVLSHV